MAKITKCLPKTIPKAANPTTEEAITLKEEADRTEEVEEETTLKEEERVLPSCRECFVNSVARRATEKISATPESIAKNIIKTANFSRCPQKSVRGYEGLNRFF